MDEAAARAEAAQRNADGGRDGLWAARRRGEEGWEVVRARVPGLEALRPTGAHVESRPRPETPGDPRPAPLQNVPPYGVV